MEDTPERNRIGTPISKFEDSPVFNYINSLSPIQPVKSIHITQTFNSLSFAAIPSIFTSPHVSTNKEFRFLKRHHFADSCKPKNSSDNGNKISASEGVMDVVQPSDNSAEPHENFCHGSPLGRAPFESDNEQPKLAMELSQPLKFDCSSSDCNPTSCSYVGADGGTALAGKSASLVSSVQEDSGKGSLEGEIHTQETYQTEHNREESRCDWESLISDTSDLLIFNLPNGAEAFQGPSQKSVEPVPQDDITDFPKQLVGLASSAGQPEMDDPSSKMEEIDQTQASLTDASPNKCMSSHQTEKTDNETGECVPFTYKPVSNLHRGMRRRCLVFEMMGVHRKNLHNASALGSSNLSQPDNEQLVSINPGSDSSRRILPGIGLHLNTLATAAKDRQIVKQEAVASGSRLMTELTSTTSLHPPAINQEPKNNSLALISLERDRDPIESGIHAAEDISQTSTYLVNEEFNQSSPKKKRLENAGEGEACKRCNCKKSKCLKLYCECFAAGVYCVEPCSCQECFNKPIHEDTVLATRKQIESRNPLAFAPKVIRSSDSIPETGDESSRTPASARHKRGCNCKKSSCLKKYCECYQGGVGCSINCRCEGCKNAFGRKDGSTPLGMEAEPPEETETSEKSATDQHLERTVIQNDEEQNPHSALPITPLQLSRPSAEQPYFLKHKPPRSSFLTVESASGLPIRRRIGKPNVQPLQTKIQRHFRTLSENEIPQILQGNGSPSSRIKVASPNKKRVSPPHCDFGSSPGRRSSRKLILQSIPAFPSDCAAFKD
ncbi:protein tesmin/TSO1-like CXC 3 isoform X2 [Malania oleifera]|uniref:protein tesmin/TSO1-like CXC 3 isoform X2 n=1 Tax=Malania oleifera TaxID=397392 RepID=UPI0025AEA6B5|nr:protein tesmin/TSO1-like CXC 3 isoform X2 [Malania oleifera]